MTFLPTEKKVHGAGKLEHSPFSLNSSAQDGGGEGAASMKCKGKGAGGVGKEMEQC